MSTPIDGFLVASQLEDAEVWDYETCDAEWGERAAEIRCVHFHTAEVTQEQADWIRALPKLEALGFCEDYDHSEASLERITDIVEERGITDLEFEETRHLAWLKRFPKTKRLRLRTHHDLSQGGLDLIAELAELERANLTDCELEASHSQALAKLTALRHLDLGGNAGLDTVEPLAGLKQLRHLSLRSTSVADLSPLAGLEHLEVLDLCSSRVANLQPLAELSSLRELDLQDCQRLRDDQLQHLAELPALSRLRLNGNSKLTDAGVGHLRGRSFEALNLTGTAVGAELRLELLKDVNEGLFSDEVQVATERQGDRWAWHRGDHWKGDPPREAIRAVEMEHAYVFDPGHLDYLLLLPALEWFSLKGSSTFHRHDLDVVMTRTQLKELDLSDTSFHGLVAGADPDDETPINDAALERLVESLPQLEVLSLSGSDVTSDGLAHLAKLTSLRRLDLSNMKLTRGLQHLANLPLESLNLGRCKFDDSKLEPLSELKGLRELDLNYVPITGKALGRLPRALEKLELSHTQVASLEGLADCVQLRELRLSATQVDDAGLASLAGLKALEILDLEHTAVGDACVPGLVGLEALKRLDLSRTKTTDASVPALAAKGLAHLALASVWLSDASLEQLQGAGIESLTLSNPSEIENRADGTFNGLDMAAFRGSLPESVGGKAWRVSVPSYDAPFPLAKVLGRLLEDPRVGEVEALVLGSWEEAYETSPQEALQALADAAPRLSALRALYVGDMDGEECEISWIIQADFSPLLAAFPQLEVLKIRGSQQLSFGEPIRHESLRSLTIECGGLPGEVLQRIASAQLPALEHLELYLGVEDYGWDGSLDDLTPILSGKAFPRLKSLGLKDSELQDEVAAAITDAPLLEQLEALDLSLGTLSDTGAQALLACPQITRLKTLDLHHHFVSEALTAKLAALSPVEVDVSSRETPEDWGGGELHRFVAVGE